MTKVIVIGANHAGTSAIRSLAGLAKDVKITAYDRNSNISFLGCGMALWVDGTVKDATGLFYADKELLENLGAEIKMEHDVLSIDPKNKTILVKNLQTGAEFTDTYDKLIYAAGSWPIKPPFPGCDLKHINIAKIYQHAEILKKYAGDKKIKDVVVVGAGYIGIEFAEAFAKAGKNVTIIDVFARPIERYFDKEFTDDLEAGMKKHKVKFLGGEKVVEFKGKDGAVSQVITDKRKIKADMVLLSIGFAPNTKLLPTADKIKNGAIIVDANMRTSIPHVYAIGDTVAIPFIPRNNEPCNIALATNAVKTGVAAAADIAGLGEAVRLDGIVGTNAIHVFGQALASTGVSEESAKSCGLTVATSLYEDVDRPEFMNDKKPSRVRVKLVYDAKTLVLLGAQIASFGERNHSDVIYFLALAVQKKMNIYQLALSDFFFLPHFNKPFNYIIKAALGDPKWLQGTAVNPFGKKTGTTKKIATKRVRA